MLLILLNGSVALTSNVFTANQVETRDANQSEILGDA